MKIWSFQLSKSSNIQHSPHHLAPYSMVWLIHHIFPPKTAPSSSSLFCSANAVNKTASWSGGDTIEDFVFSMLKIIKHPTQPRYIAAYTQWCDSFIMHFQPGQFSLPPPCFAGLMGWMKNNSWSGGRASDCSIPRKCQSSKGGREEHVGEHPDMMSASEGGYGKAKAVREVAWIL